VKLGYEFTYLYCALNPVKGHLLCRLLPDMTKASFHLFVNYFSRQVKQRYPRQKVLLILDQASCHHSKGEAGNLMLKYLPVASPELNCVERLFEELRKPLSNQVFPNIGEVERFLANVLKQYYQNPKLLIKLCYFPYMRRR
jgi:transposase